MCARIIDSSQDVNVTAIAKGSERYILVFRDKDEAEIFRQMGRWACDPELSFTWLDAVVISLRIRNGTS